MRRSYTQCQRANWPESFTRLCTGHRFILSGAIPPSFLSLWPPHFSPSIYALEHCLEHHPGPGQASWVAELNLKHSPCPPRGLRVPPGALELVTAPLAGHTFAQPRGRVTQLPEGSGQTFPPGIGGGVSCSVHPVHKAAAPVPGV